MRKEIQEHFDRLDREVVNINNEAARNYLALNDKMNDVLQAVVELKNMIPTADLIEELKRQGATTTHTGPYQPYDITAKYGANPICGSAEVLVIQLPEYKKAPGKSRRR